MHKIDKIGIGCLIVGVIVIVWAALTKEPLLKELVNDRYISCKLEGKSDPVCRKLIGKEAEKLLDHN